MKFLYTKHCCWAWSNQAQHLKTKVINVNKKRPMHHLILCQHLLHCFLSPFPASVVPWPLHIIPSLPIYLPNMTKLGILMMILVAPFWKVCLLAASSANDNGQSSSGIYIVSWQGAYYEDSANHQWTHWTPLIFFSQTGSVTLSETLTHMV